MRFTVSLCLALALLALCAGRGQACGADSDCTLGDRVYRIYTPARPASAPMGAILFAHGYRGNAAGTMGDASLRALADELGVALVAPQASDGDWRIPNRPRHRDDSGAFEFDYFRSLIDRLEQHHHVDRHKLLMAGFSTGGMLTWTLACHMGGAFAGFAPIAGTFWAPVPRSCPAASVSLMHVHGTSDDMVPLTGRAIADSAQGDVGAALALFAAQGGFGAERPVPADDGLSCTRRDNPKGQLLEFCSHPGSHGYKAAYLRRAWQAMHIDSVHGQ